MGRASWEEEQKGKKPQSGESTGGARLSLLPLLPASTFLGCEPSVSPGRPGCAGRGARGCASRLAPTTMAGRALLLGGLLLPGVLLSEAARILTVSLVGECSAGGPTGVPPALGVGSARSSGPSLSLRLSRLGWSPRLRARARRGERRSPTAGAKTLPEGIQHLLLLPLPTQVGSPRPGTGSRRLRPRPGPETPGRLPPGLPLRGAQRLPMGTVGAFAGPRGSRPEVRGCFCPRSTAWEPGWSRGHLGGWSAFIQRKPGVGARAGDWALDIRVSRGRLQVFAGFGGGGGC